jgi:hypothetical protein
MSSAVVYSISSPVAGQWSVDITGSATDTASIFVSAQSTLNLDDFQFVEIKGRPGHEGAMPIVGLPKPNQSAYAMAEFSGAISEPKFEFRRRDGSIISTFSLAANDPHDESVYTGQVLVPNESFFAYVVGKNATGTTFQRMVSTGFIPQQIAVAAPVATGSARGQTTAFLFQARNDGSADSFRVSVTDNRGFTRLVSASPVSLPTGGTQTIRVEVTPPLATAINLPVTLTVSLESTTRSEVRNFAVLTTLVTDTAVAGDVNRDGVVNCDDLGLVRASFGKRVGQIGFNTLVDLDTNGIVDVRDLATIARLVPVGTVCPR